MLTVLKYFELFFSNYFIDLFLSFKIHTSQARWCTLTGFWLNKLSSLLCLWEWAVVSWVILERTLFVILLVFIKCVCLNNENHSPGQPSVFNYFCVFCPCVTKWKPSKPRGVIGLSTWIFDWFGIKNSVKGNGRNKRRETSHDRSRQTEGGLRSQAGRAREITLVMILMITVELELWLVSVESARKNYSIFCRAAVKFKRLNDVLSENSIFICCRLHNAPMITYLPSVCHGDGCVIVLSSWSITADSFIESTHIYMIYCGEKSTRTHKTL